MQVPALVIAGTHSGVGKTTISIALMAALRRRGMRVQPFKIGPDFIDPTLHTRASARTSRNLDGWMLSARENIAVFRRASVGADIAIIEGVMGLFDGRDGSTEEGSTAQMAKLLGVPVLLVVDASAIARSAAALVHGYESFDSGLDVAGVIFNNVAGESHFAYLREAVGSTCAARVLGWLPADENIRLPERHLGLVMADEILDSERLERLIEWVEAGLDLNAVAELAQNRPRARATETRIAGQNPQEEDRTQERTESLVRDAEEIRPAGSRLAHRPAIGIARDRAFCFYYQDNLDLLSEFGAEIIEFSPIRDTRLPDGLDGIYFGGGYPELYARELAANEPMRADIARFAGEGRPVYAECGGLMYLTEAIIDLEGCSHPMARVFPSRARMRPRLTAIGYAEVEGLSASGWLRIGEHARGHEFRYSVIDEMPSHIARKYRVVTRTSARAEGFGLGCVLASYVHLHFRSCPRFAARLVAACACH